jgi:hypothetical protein
MEPLTIIYSDKGKLVNGEDKRKRMVFERRIDVLEHNIPDEVEILS